MNELNGVKKTITTLEISEMLGVKHYKVLENYNNWVKCLENK